MRKTRKIFSVLLAVLLLFPAAQPFGAARAAGPEGPVTEEPENGGRLFAVPASPAKVFVEYDGSALLKVKAFCADAEPTYKWMLIPADPDAEEIPLADGDGPSYFVKNVKRAAHYKCIVYGKNEANCAVDFTVGVENGFTVCVGGLPDRIVSAGQAQTIGVNAHADKGEISYRWRVSRIERSADGATVIHETEYLPVTESWIYVSLRSGLFSEYVCEVSDIYGNREEVRFTVTAKGEIKLQMPQYNTVFVPYGEEAELEIFAEWINGARYQWSRFEDGAYQPIEGETDRILSLPQVKSAASYMCFVYDINGLGVEVYFDVYVYSGLAVTAPDPYNEIFVSEGNSAQLYVEAAVNAGESAYYAWYYMEADSETEEWNPTEETNRMLVTGPVTKDRLYRCDVSDDYGLVISTYFYVLVNTGFNVEGIETSGVVTREIIADAGDDIPVRVNAHIAWGRDLAFEWYINGDKLDFSGEELLLENVNDDLTVTCNVSDGCGKTVSEQIDIVIMYGGNTISADTSSADSLKGTLRFGKGALPADTRLEIKPAAPVPTSNLPSLYERYKMINVYSWSGSDHYNPSEQVIVTVALPEEMQGHEVTVYQGGDRLTWNRVPSVTDGGSVTFFATVCGIFILADDSSKRITGDVDGNGEIEPADARLALRCSLGLTQDGDKKMTHNDIMMADANADGYIEPGDARLILRKSLGLPVEREGWYDLWD